jgi:hypothetical protein
MGDLIYQYFVIFKFTKHYIVFIVIPYTNSKVDQESILVLLNQKPTEQMF